MNPPSDATRAASPQDAKLPFGPPTMFAPMEGVTHPILRELTAARGGVGVVCTEFVRVTANPLGSTTLKKHVVRPSCGALSVQVMGNHLAQMAEATRLVTDAGADIVDINLGCPAPRAVRKGVGSAMLKDIALLSRVLEVMRKSTSLPLSAKIRAGYDDASRVLDIARAVQDAGVDFLTVHPRRRVDFYQGVADWRIIGRLVRELSIPVIGNGDVWYASDALRMQEETGCAAVMIGRPALRNPWIFRQIAALRGGEDPIVPDGPLVVEHARQLASALVGEYSERGALGMMKEQVRYLGRALVEPGDFQKRALRSGSVVELVGEIERTFAPLSAEALDLQAASSGRERSGSGLATDREVSETAPATCPSPGAFGLVATV